MPFSRVSSNSRTAAVARRSVVVTENLEQRSLMSVSVGSDGFTDVVKSSDSKVIYVSSTGGSDSNSGLSSDSPVKSISKGMSLMRSGSPDHLLLKRGDSWTEKLSWGKSGRSASEPAYLGAYGTGSRPMIKSGSGNGIEAIGSTSNVVIQGIHLFAHNRDPQASGYSRNSGGYGIRWVGGTNGLLVEDTVIDQYKFNILIQPTNSSISNVKLRRNVITDAYSGDGSHSSGIYAQGINGLTLEENVFDHNGWHDSIGGQTSQNHNAYISEANNNVKVIGNVFANGSSHGAQVRSGGEVRDNLFIKNPIHLSFGLVNGSPLKSGGVTGSVSGNVFLDGRTIGGGVRGWGVELGNIRSATVSDNIFHDDGPGAAGAIMLGVGTNLTNSGSGVGINDLVIEDNVVQDWHHALEMSGSLNVGGSGNSSLNNLTVRNNDFQNAGGQYNRILNHINTLSTSEEKWSNNRYYDESSSDKWMFVNPNTMSFANWKSRMEPTAQSVKVNYNNPNANIDSYAGSYSSFMNKVRGQSSSNWSGGPAKGAIAYMRGAFNMGAPTSPSPTPEPTPEPPVVPTPPLSTDTTKPTVVSKSGNSTSVKIKFSENVKASIAASDITITKSGTSTKVSGLKVSYNTSTNEATWTWTYNGGRLSSGRWEIKLPDQNVTDAAGNRLAGGSDIVWTITV